MKILIVDDDEMLSATLAKVLETNNYVTELANNGEVGLDLATMVEFDLILLDVQIPKLDGISLCRQLRSRGYHKPILLLTASDTDADVVAGFDAGADDYISKPCTPEVLLARIRTWMRRSKALGASPSAQNAPTTLTWGALCLDHDAGRVTIGDQVIALTATEYNLLELFLQNPERIFSRSAILDQLWGFDDAPTDRAIVTHVKDVRKKLKAGGLTEEIIETVYGMGYRLKPAAQATAQISPLDKSNLHQGRSAAASRTAIDQVLQRFRGVFHQQVAVLEQAKTALRTATLAPEQHQAAQQEAHKLAGSLASFGYPNGSKLARSIEHWLINHPASDSRFMRSLTAQDITQFTELVEALHQEIRQEPVESNSAPTTSLATYRVLVIDDDIALTEQLQSEAIAWGVRLQIAPNVATARSQLTQHSPDLVLLDLSFPAVEDDGLTLLKEITAQLPDLPVIVLTGRDSLPDRLAVSRLGARQFLQKPASPEQIFRAIARVLAQPTTPEAKVLIVDDDPAMLANLSTMLAPWGLEVAVLSNPQHFWQTLVAISPDLILLDLEMPGINGLELCQVVRQDAQWGDLPILVVTAHTEADSLQQAFGAGADDFITKPVLGPELVTRVLSRIQRNRTRHRSGQSDLRIRRGTEA